MDRRRLGELAGAAGCVGDMYGLPLPRTPREVSKLGAAWLTKCLPGQEKSAKFHKGDDHPGAVMLRWAAKHDLVVGDAV